MAGFREFVTGEVLTAGNVMDFLQKQAVMKFADAAARDAAVEAAGAAAVEAARAARAAPMMVWPQASHAVAPSRV